MAGDWGIDPPHGASRCGGSRGAKRQFTPQAPSGAGAMRGELLEVREWRAPTCAVYREARKPKASSFGAGVRIDLGQAEIPLISGTAY